MRNLSISAAFAALAIISTMTAHAADNTFGKIFIKAAIAEVNGQPFPDLELDATVKDVKKRTRKFVLADSESEADYLLVVVERRAVAVSGQPASKTVLATLSIRDGATWKPAAKLQSGVRNVIWGVAADQVIKQAEKWAKENSGK